MNVKPILFNTDMVRALLADRKTVTRRVVKPQPFAVTQDGNAPCWCGHFISESGKVLVDKPPYHPGDILYVRETWRKWIGGYSYKADAPWASQWRPSIHMPRVERLQEISSQDIEREGVDLTDLQGIGCITRHEYVHAFQTLWNSIIKPTDCAHYGWEANPYVWVISFERCEKPEDGA